MVDEEGLWYVWVENASECISEHLLVSFGIKHPEEMGYQVCADGRRWNLYATSDFGVVRCAVESMQARGLAYEVLRAIHQDGQTQLALFCVRARQGAGVHREP